MDCRRENGRLEDWRRARGEAEPTVVVSGAVVEWEMERASEPASKSVCARLLFVVVAGATFSSTYLYTPCVMYVRVDGDELKSWWMVGHLFNFGRLVDGHLFNFGSLLIPG